MARAIAQDGPAIPAKGTKNYINAEKGIMSWLTTVDHKRIGLMYFVSTLIAFILGGFFALVLRLELLNPGKDILTAPQYNQAFTLHGAIMVFLFIIPSIPGALANFLLPIMIGAKDVAFPKLNLLSLYLYWIGATFTMSSLVSTGLDTGWTFYVPYSATVSQTSVIAVTFGVFILGFSSILTGLNFIVTLHKLRAPGITWYRLPLFLWSIYATSLVQILATPVLAITLLLLIFERWFGVGIFDPKLGGDPVLYQHFFWFYSHPAVYIMILPGMGIISDLISVIRTVGSSDTRRSRSRASRSRSSASSYGATTCSRRVRASSRRPSSRSSRSPSRSHRGSRSSTGRARCGAARSASRRRCSTR
jgi:cytochrome c oxidase subunit I